MKQDVLFSTLLTKVIKEKIDFSNTELSNLTQGQLAELYVIRDLESEPNNVVSSIADRLGKTMSSVSKNLKTLETKGFITRISKLDDRRNVYISIDNNKYQIVNSFYKEVEKYVNQFYEDLSEDEIEVLVKIEDKFSEI